VTAPTDTEDPRNREIMFEVINTECSERRNGMTCEGGNKILASILTIVFVVSLILAGVTSCDQARSSEEADPSSIEVSDQLGRIVKLEGIPQRIISLAPSNTEILFALGLADRVVGVTDYCNYPPEAQDKPSIGGFSTPNMEEVIALSPDLVLAADIHEDEIIPQMEEKGISVLAITPLTIDEVLEAIILIGEVTGTEEEASQLLADMRDRINRVTGLTASLPEEERPGVFYFVWHDPLMVAGASTFQDDLIQKAGGINLAAGLDEYATLSLEGVLQANPAVMIVGTSHGSGEDLTLQFIETETRLRETDARQNDRVYDIDGDIASRSGPRLVDALEQFARFIHPELFDD
jgi:iron complex transport system substrate-binding protein